jgi:hypothetical protein
MAVEFSDESLLLERSPLVTEVEKCLEDGSLDLPGAAGCVVVVEDDVGVDAENLEVEWLEK